MMPRKPGAPRPAASYRANRPRVRKADRQPCPLPVIALARPPKSGKAWPNPQNPVQGTRECARRVWQSVRVLRAENMAMDREWLTSPAVGREMI